MSAAIYRNAKVLVPVTAVASMSAPTCLWTKTARAQYYKTFYVPILRLYVISKSVCPWQAFPALLVRSEPTLMKYLSGAPL